MILFCPSCHRSFVFEDDEVQARGGPSAFHCDECNGQLTTMEEGLGISLSSKRDQTRPDGMAMALEDEDGGTLIDPHMGGPDDEATHIRPSFDHAAPHMRQGGSALVGSAAYNAAEPTTLDTPAVDQPRPRLSPRLTGEQDVPADLHTPRASPPQNQMPRTGAHDAIKATGSHPSVGRTGAVPMMQRTGAQPAIGGANPSQANVGGEVEPVARSGRSTGLMVGIGCVVVAVIGVALALIIGVAAWFTSGDSPDAVDNKTADAATAPVKRAPIGDRLLEASSAVSDTAVPAVSLVEQAHDGEVIFVGPKVWHEGDVVAKVVFGGVDASAKPSSSSPFVIPLGRRLEDAFGGGEDDMASRWVVVLPDGKATYQALYDVMYTAYNRGARIQLAAINPMNPNAFLAVEVVPVEWPHGDIVDVPEEFKLRDPDAIVDTGVKAILLTVDDRGYTIRRVGEKPEKAILVEKLMNAHPVSSLRQELKNFRKEDTSLRAVRLQVHPEIGASTLLQTIAAALAEEPGLPSITQVRLEPPASKKK